MKRYSITVFLACIIAVLSSCRQSPNYLLDERFETQEYLQAYDMQVEYALNGSGERVCRAGDVYYFASQESSYIYYYDESSDSYGKLCGKAECTHDSKKCNAYIEVWKSTLQVYDGALYFIGDGGTLYRMELTGDAREEVMRLPAGNTANFKVVLHRGYVYYSEIKEVVEAGQSRYDYILRQARIGQADSSKVLIERKIDKGIPLEHWWIIGNTLYQYVADVFSLDNGVISAFYQYDIKSGELKVLQDGETPWSMTSYLVRGTEIMTVQNNKQQERRIVKGETVEPFELSSEPYAAYKLAEEVIIEYNSICKTGEVPTYALMNWEGQRIYTGTFPGTVSGSIMNYTYCGEDEKGFLFAVKGLGMPQAGVELVRIPYDGSKGEVLVRIKSEK